MYKVLDDCNVLEEISDEDIQKALSENNVTYMIMQAMGQSHRAEYMKYITPFLDGEYFYIRRAAIEAILNVNGQLGLEAMKEKCEKYSLEDEDPWNKILLMTAILITEEGTKGMKKYFISEEGDSRIKDSILTFYRRGYQFTQSDIELICFYIRSYMNQSFEWIKKLKKSDRKESIDFAFDSLACAGECTSVLSEISDELSEEICGICEEGIEKKIGSDSIYYIAEITHYMRKEYAIRILRVLNGKVKGSAKTLFKKSLKRWNINEEEL